ALARRAQVGAPEEIVSSFYFAGLLESEHKGSLRIHPAEHMPDGTVLAGRVAAARRAGIGCRPRKAGTGACPCARHAFGSWVEPSRGSRSCQCRTHRFSTTEPSPRARSQTSFDSPSWMLPLRRDSPDESQTGINVRGFPAVLQDRHEVRTATSTSGNPNAWSRVSSGHFPWHLDALPLSVALECLTSNVSR